MRWALVVSPLCWLVVVSSLVKFLLLLFAAIIACSRPRSGGRALLERCRRRLVWDAVSDRFTFSGCYLLLFRLVLSCTRHTWLGLRTFRFRAYVLLVLFWLPLPEFYE